MNLSRAANRGALLVTLATLVTGVGCSTPSPSASTEWARTLDSCVASSVMSKVTYMGPSNPVGPGSIWRIDHDGSLRLRWTPADFELDDDVVQPGQPFPCSSMTSRTLRISASQLLESELFASDPRLTTAIDSARRAETSINSFRVDLLKEGRYEQALRNLPAVSPVAREFGQAGRIVMTSAVLVDGFEMRLFFESATAADVQLTLPLSETMNFRLGADFEARWVTDRELVLRSTESFYVAGRFHPLSADRTLGSSTTAPVLGDQEVTRTFDRLKFEAPYDLRYQPVEK